VTGNTLIDASEFNCANIGRQSSNYKP